MQYMALRSGGFAARCCRVEESDFWIGNPSDGCVNDKGIGHVGSNAQCPIVFDNAAVAEIAGEGLSGSMGAGKDDHSRSASPQAVYGSWIVAKTVADEGKQSVF